MTRENHKTKLPGARMVEAVRMFTPDRVERMGIIELYITSAKEVIDSYDLVKQLFKRDFTGVYRKSILGIAWLIASPIIAIVSWTFMNRFGILKPGSVGVPYSLYVLTGSTVWGLFMAFYQAGSETLSSGAGFITQVNFPHQALLAKQIGHHAATASIGLILVLVVLITMGYTPNLTILLFPFTLLPLLFLGSGIGMMVSIFSAVAIDLSRGVTILIGLLMYATPIIFSPNPENSFLKTIISFNPLTYLISLPREILLHGRVTVSQGYAWSLLFSLIVFLIAWRFFILCEGRTIEKLM